MPRVCEQCKTEFNRRGPGNRCTPCSGSRAEREKIRKAAQNRSQFLGFGKTCIICSNVFSVNTHGEAIRQTCSLTCQVEQGKRRGAVRAAEQREEYNKYSREKQRTSEYKEKRYAYQKTPEYLEKRRARSKQRRRTDPDFREYENRRQLVKHDPDARAALSMEFAQRKLEAAAIAVASSLSENPQEIAHNVESYHA